MGDIMRPVPFSELLDRVFSEYASCGSIFGIPEERFFTSEGSASFPIFRERIATPVGPAAGPHTQLAQNLITAYLCGGRFFELKTVQKLDQLELDKPCIDAEDECYNTEWSTELTVKKAYDEYVKAWIIIHVLEAVFSLSGRDVDLFDSEEGFPRQLPFAFNMSVGYDLAGIKLPKMDAFISDLSDASKNKYFDRCIEELRDMMKNGRLLKGPAEGIDLLRLAALPDNISRRVCTSLTISTLHGCPPEEIESIAEYIINEKQLDTMVKLNPTLLGFDRVRSILDGIGFGHIELKEETFTHDLQYGDAMPMIKKMLTEGEKNGLSFGVKLSNTLPSVNGKGYLPDEEMYMSGRSLYPLTVNLAADLAEDFGPGLPISFCAGISSLTIGEILQAGIGPVTMATDLLKPGGYLRMKAAAETAGKLSGDRVNNGSGTVNNGSGDRVKRALDPDSLRQLAEAVQSNPVVQKSWRGHEKASIPGTLPLFNCYAAPCMHACPIHQDIPAYISLVGEGKYDEALSLIYDKNPLPTITGTICDHQCMYHCTRIDYEGAVQIRDVKLAAAEKGTVKRETVKRGQSNAVDTGGTEGAIPADKRKVAVIGAGPAGLSAAFFLARSGFDVTVFEKEKEPGGVVRHVLPEFRLTKEAIERDVEFIRSHGVQFQYGASPDLAMSDMQKEGFAAVCLAVGAEVGNELSLTGDRVLRESLEFLRECRSAAQTGKGGPKPGKHVAVVGGGNTAMDSARAAIRCQGVESVTVYYRRSEAEMPADREEYENALEDGVTFSFLMNPKEYTVDGDLILDVMKLGELDASGRRRPEPTGETHTAAVDTVISAIGEHVDADYLKRFGLEVDERGRVSVDDETLCASGSSVPVYLLGDAHTGPSTVVECIAEGRRTADAIAKVAGLSVEEGMNTKERFTGDPKELLSELAARKELIVGTETKGDRCLECDLICNKCVEVCPNRANICLSLPRDGVFTDLFQVLHLDAYCNECGNCATFCPYDGKPYTDKTTIFSLEEDFKNSENTGFLMMGDRVKIRLKGKDGILQQDNGSLQWMDSGEIDEDHPDTLALVRLINHVKINHNYLLGKVER